MRGGLASQVLPASGSLRRKALLGQIGWREVQAVLTWIQPGSSSAMPLQAPAVWGARKRHGASGGLSRTTIFFRRPQAKGLLGPLGSLLGEVESANPAFGPLVQQLTSTCRTCRLSAENSGHTYMRGYGISFAIPCAIGCRKAAPRERHPSCQEACTPLVGLSTKPDRTTIDLAPLRAKQTQPPRRTAAQPKTFCMTQAKLCTRYTIVPCARVSA